MNNKEYIILISQLKNIKKEIINLKDELNKDNIFIIETLLEITKILTSLFTNNKSEKS